MVNRPVKFEITLSPASERTVTIKYRTYETGFADSATPEVDYTPVDSSATFVPGKTKAYVEVDVADDSDEDSGEPLGLLVHDAYEGSGREKRALQIRNAVALGTIGNREEPLPGAPRVNAVAINSDASGDGHWTPGERIEATLTFNEAVKVGSARAPTVEASADGHATSLVYASGSGTNTLTFGVDVRQGDYTRIAVEANSLHINGTSIVGLASGLPAGLDHEGATNETEAAEPGPLTVAFTDLPARHDAEPFTFGVEFSEEVTIGYAALRDYAMSATNARVSAAKRVTQGENRAWRVTVVPASEGEITLTLNAHADCSGAGAVCTSDGRGLSSGLAVMVPGPTQVPAPASPFTVGFAGVPAEHDGSSAVTFDVRFNKEPAAQYSYKTMRDTTLRVRQSGARISPRAARRIVKGSNQGWRITVVPASNANMRVSIEPTTDCAHAGAVCTGASPPQKLGTGGSAAIMGPPGVAVADASASEGIDESVDFVVTMSRASASTVSVGYHTSDSTAKAGIDYTETSGRLEFEPGETSATIAVPILDDSHDEGSETFTLTLSSPAGGNAWISNAAATGTIENDDPMPKAWITRFGRTVAAQAVDAIGGRLESRARSHVTVAGIDITRAGTSHALEEDRRLEDQLETLGTEREATLRSVSPQALLHGASFRMRAEGGAGAPAWTGWGQIETGGFEADVDGTALDAGVTSAFIGADVERGDWLAGVAVSMTQGSGDYRLIEGDDAGKVKSTLTTVYPYVRVALGERIDLWALAGAGSGALEMTQAGRAGKQGDARYRTDIGLRMGATGLRAEVVSPEGRDGLALAVKGDAFWVRTRSDAVTNADGKLEGAEGTARRLRLLVETSHGFDMRPGTLTPTLEMGLRHDGGDAESGTGVEVGAGLRYEGARIAIEGHVGCTSHL